MSSILDKEIIQFRRNTASQAAANNSILNAGEPGYEVDTGRMKIGDGSTPWNELPYVNKHKLTVSDTAPESPVINDVWLQPE